MAVKKLLFVGGCGRSGTSALVGTLNSHQSIVVGQERYWNLWNSHSITPNLFTPERFIQPINGDSHNSFEKQDASYNYSGRIQNCIYLGDKFPRIYEHYNTIDELFPSSTILYIFRNPLSVAESYQSRFEDPNDNWKLDFRAAVDAWNRSLEATVARVKEGKKILMISYECLYSDVEMVKRLFNEIDVDYSGVDQNKIDFQIHRNEQLRMKMVPRREEIRRWVALKARLDLYKTLALHPTTITKLSADN